MGRAFEVRKASMMKTSAAKSKLYARFGKEIYMAAKNGADPESNLTLKRVIAKARDKQVPGDIIKRAIDKAKGGAGESYAPARYEGFGPGNSMIIVDCLTDNVNRTVSEVRNCFTKTDSKMGVAGCVSHMYQHLSIVGIEGMDEEEVLEALIMADIDINDIETEDDTVVVYGMPNDLYTIQDAIKAAKDDVNISMSESTWLPSNYVTLSGDDLKKFEKFMTMINECEDVQEVYHNVKIEE